MRIDVVVGAHDLEHVEHVLLTERAEILRTRIGRAPVELVALASRAVPAAFIETHRRRHDVPVALGELDEVVVFHHVAGAASEAVQRDHERRRVRAVGTSSGRRGGIHVDVSRRFESYSLDLDSRQRVEVGLRARRLHPVVLRGDRPRKEAGRQHERRNLGVHDVRYFAVAQTKLAASFMSPVPLYLATCGYGQSGRWRATPFEGSPSTYFVAMILSGAVPFSTQRSSESSASWSASR